MKKGYGLWLSFPDDHTASAILSTLDNPLCTPGAMEITQVPQSLNTAVI